MSPEQIEAAKQVDILDYLQCHEPGNLKREGANRYTLRDHDSLVISNGKWVWFSHGFGCETATALNYLIKVRGYDFVDAVQTLTGETAVPTRGKPDKTKAPPEKKPFILPPRNTDNRRVIAYLQSRGIDRDSIMDCIARGDLYESASYHNCVFTGKNEESKTRFACVRSTTGRFRRDVDGSDKRYGFLLPPKKSENGCAVAIFESAIDALSHQTMCKRGYLDWDGWRLSLSGGSLLALTHFVEKHPEISHVSVCTDRDEAGQKLAEKIEALPAKDERFGRIAVEVSPPIAGNDYNDTLTMLQSKVQGQRKNLIFRGDSL